MNGKTGTPPSSAKALKALLKAVRKQNPTPGSRQERRAKVAKERAATKARNKVERAQARLIEAGHVGA